MDFNNLINKGKEALAGKDGKIDYSAYQKDAQDAYKTFSGTEGSYKDKATAAYSEYKKEHAGDSSASAGSASTGKTESVSSEKK